MPVFNTPPQDSKGGRRTFNGRPLMLRDSQLASSLFRFDTTQPNTPKPKFMFYVRFVPLGGFSESVNQNFGAIADYLGNNKDTLQGDTSNVLNDITNGNGSMVMNVERPTYNIDTETLNSYGVKRVIQKKIEYQPITMRFYDTVDNNLWKLFNKYLKYYYGESRAMSDQAWSKRTIDNEMFGLPGAHWGFNPPKLDFFSRIEVYEFFGKHYTRFDLVNPKIQSFKPDELDQAAGNVALHVSMQVAFDGIVMQAINASITDAMVNEFGFLLSDFYDVENNKQYWNPGPSFGASVSPISGQQSATNNFIESLTNQAINRLNGNTNGFDSQGFYSGALSTMGFADMGGNPTISRNQDLTSMLTTALLGQSSNNYNRSGVGTFGILSNSENPSSVVAVSSAGGNTTIENNNNVPQSYMVPNTGNEFDYAYGVVNSANGRPLVSSMVAAGVVAAAKRSNVTIDQIIQNTSDGLRISSAGLAGVNSLRPVSSQIGVIREYEKRPTSNPIETRMDLIRRVDDKYFR